MKLQRKTILTNTLAFYFVSFPVVTQFQPLVFSKVSPDNLLILFSIIIFFPVLTRTSTLKRSSHFWIFFYLSVAIIGLLGLLQGIKPSSSWHNPLIFFQMSLLFIMIDYLSDKLVLFCKAFLIGGAIASGFGFAQFLSDWAWQITDDYYLNNILYITDSLMYGKRLASVSFFPPNGNFFGSYMVFCILVCLAIRMHIKYNLFIFLIACYSVALLLSLSLTSWGSIFFAYTTTVFLRTLVKVFHRGKLPVEFVIISTITISLLGAFYFLMQESYWAGFANKIYRYFLVTDPSTGLPAGMTQRILLWKSNLKMIKSPLEAMFGVGFGQVILVDNYLLHIFVATGSFGTLTLLISMSKGISIAVRHVMSTPFLLIALITFSVLNLTAAYALYMPVAIGVFFLIKISSTPLHGNTSNCSK